MSKCIITAPARVDLKEINRFIASYSPEAARRFKEKIRQQLKVMKNFPNMGRKRDEILPFLRSFPIDDYIIFYRPIGEGIEVIL